MGGDFRQCLPVVPHAHRAAIVQTSLKYSHLWTGFTTLTLKTNIRAEDTSYRDWLLKIGNEELSTEFGDDIIKIPNEMLAQDSIIREVFGERLKPSEVKSFSKSAILCPRNDDVCQINEEVLHILEGELYTYLSIDKVDCNIEAERENYPVEFFE